MLSISDIEKGSKQSDVNKPTAESPWQHWLCSAASCHDMP